MEEKIFCSTTNWEKNQPNKALPSFLSSNRHIMFVKYAPENQLYAFAYA